MDLNIFSPAFLAPSILCVIMLMLPITVLSEGRLSMINTFIISCMIYVFILASFI